MQDEEYPAYLKTQSYGDLVSISCSIDKEAHGRRYEMVMAEIAERNKRGERKEVDMSPPTATIGRAARIIGCTLGLWPVLFLVAFVGPMVLYPNNPQGPLWAILFVLPFGWIPGLVVGVIWASGVKKKAEAKDI